MSFPNVSPDVAWQAVLEQQGVRYLKRTRVGTPDVSTYDWGQSPYYLANRSEFEQLTACYGEGIRTGQLANLHLQMVSPKVGWGVFAGQPLAPGDFVGEYTGVILPIQDTPPDQKHQGHFLSDYAWNYPDELPDGREFEVTALLEGNLLRYVNHSFSPNVTVDHTLVDGLFITFFRVIEPIATGEQLLVDYGEDYWSGGFRELVLL